MSNRNNFQIREIKKLVWFNQQLSNYQLMMKQELIVRYNNVTKRKWWQRLLRKKVDYTELKDRMIVSNVPDQQLQDNTIQTAKYHLASFFLFNLLEQFTKPSNVYFLIIGVLQIIPAISVSQGKPTMFLPLSIVVFVSMIKDFIEDWKRHLSDRKENSKKIQVLTDAGFLKRHWSSIRVGQIIKIRRDEYIPCDILLLKHGKQAKTAFVQTKNLDGQTNLKLKKAPDCMNFLQKQPQIQLSNLSIQVAYEKPNPYLSSFNGTLKYNNKKQILQITNIMLRGCSLKINSVAYGMCIYNGHQTKIMLNAGKIHSKRSTLQQYLNVYFLFICIFQLVATLLSAILYGILLSLNFQNLRYMYTNTNVVAEAGFTWGSWFISFSNFIPISLLITVELVRYGQARLLQKDQACASKGRFTDVQTSSVNQQLGQLQYVLSDKTGTLTMNKMQFKCLFVGGKSYGDEFQRSRKGTTDQFDINLSLDLQSRDHENTIQYPHDIMQQKQQGKHQEMVEQYDGQYQNPHDMPSPHKITQELQKITKRRKSSGGMPFVDFAPGQKSRLSQDLHNNNSHSQKIHSALLHLSLCHNVLPEKQSYTSSSPDEIALVSFAKYMGYKFLDKNQENEMQILINESIKKFKLLNVLQFSSQRKRMSVIIRNQQTNQIKLLCKGADDVILQRVDAEENVIQNMMRQLSQYAIQGLRTLVLAQRQISQEQYKQWAEKYHQVLTELSETRMEKIFAMESLIEKNMKLIGATAIEDKLQENVKETISALSEAGIKIWMLTGDKKQTAVSIGYSCGLITDGCQRITLDCEAQHASNLIQNVQKLLPLIKQDKVVIVSGQLIKSIDDLSLQRLSSLLKIAKSVICCRVSPKDKQYLTSLVKKWGKVLAIGDGANDVNMIGAAHVGVGVRGIEGSQATRAADYVISEFKTIKRLITYHGLNYYHRNSHVCRYIIYKNIIVTLPLLVYGPLSMFSAIYFYQNWIFQLYNTFYTALPIIMFGLFDTIYYPSKCTENYRQGQTNSYFNIKILLRLVATSIFLSIIIDALAFYGAEFTLSPRSYGIYLSWSGMLIFAAIVISVNLRIVLISNQISIIQLILLVLGVAAFYSIYLGVQSIFYTDIKNTLYSQITSPMYWILLVLIITVIQLLQFTIYALEKLVFFSPIKPSSMPHSGIEIQMQDSARPFSPSTKQKKTENTGYAFAEDEQRSLHFI